MNYDNSAKINFEAQIDSQMEKLSALPNYKILQETVETWKKLRCGHGLQPIIADNYCKKIIAATDEQLFEWEKSFLSD